jgi:hypothetical protein
MRRNVPDSGEESWDARPSIPPPECCSRLRLRNAQFPGLWHSFDSRAHHQSCRDTERQTGFPGSVNSPDGVLAFGTGVRIGLHFDNSHPFALGRNVKT